MAALGLARFFAEISQNVRHAFVSAVADGATATQVQPSHWNAAHTVPDVEAGAMPGVYVETVAAGTNEVLGSGENRWQKRLLSASQCRIQAYVTEAIAATTLGLQYTTDLTGATGWTTMGVSVSVAAVGSVVSSWVNVPAGAQGSGGVLMRWVVIN